MSGAILRFPLRRMVLVCRERDGADWLAIAGSHGWLFGSIIEARDEARALGRHLELPIREFVA